jgi:predicted choloylglycine hydrolase
MAPEAIMEGYAIEKARFGVARLCGTGREIGRSLGRWLRESRPEAAGSLIGAAFEPRAKGFRGMDELARLCETACPGMVEEIEGFAEALGVASDRVAFWAWTSLKGANCSHAAVSPAMSATGTPLVMRSYEWRPDQDDLTLCVTKKEGAYAHIGCSSLVFGRMDGMNEKGLSVTMSGGMAAGLPHEWNYRKGLNFWVALRGMLERCADSGEALSFLRACVPTGNHCFIVADSKGKAVLAEMSGGELATREMGGEGYIAEANHFTLPGMAERNKHDFILAGSVPRLAYIGKAISGALPRVTPGDLKELLKGEAPNGCFGPWYSEGFGTLWASVFDLGARRAEYCFGAPGFGPWESFGLDGPEGFEEREAVFAKK